MYSSFRPSLARCRRLHVGRPHPISNMRPVVYEDNESEPPRRAYHPYSLHEFDATPSSPLKLQYKLQRQSLDDFHHAFWLESNTRFEQGKCDALAQLAETATQLDKERALSAFYAHWVAQEELHLAQYTQEWRQRNSANLSLAIRVASEKVTSRLFGLFRA
ncbi:hypothetical protein MKEN_01205700 [Mycena kentingensis (nom. inval.)]|nr:hypothetical protein MKEN_01205700 [Mycena kentingensis (nom. inval.)]